MTTRTFYSVHTMILRKFHNQDPHWAESGYEPGGRTIEEAHEQIRENMERIGLNYLDEVKFKIVQTTEIKETVEEILGEEALFFMLKG